MAQKYLVRCKDASQTSGTGTLTLDNSTSANWQTPAQAVARTLLANGDTVRYTISDTSDPVLYEEGIGTIGSAGLTLTRDTVRQSSSGTSKISWPSGGARDVVISWSPGDTALVSNNGSEFTAATFATNLGLPRLAAANDFELNQNAITLHEFGNANTGSSAAAQVKTQSDVANLTIGSNSSTRTGTRFGSSISSRAEVLGVGTPLNIGTTGSHSVLFGTNSNLVAQMTTGGSFQDASGNKFDAFPSGTKFLFGATPPTGWTRVNETNRTIIQLARAADTIGATGGSDDPFDGAWSTVGHTLTEAQIPSHTHPPNPIDTGILHTNTGGASAIDGSGIAVFSSRTATGSTGGGGSHSHNMATPFFRVACWATKD